MIISHSFVKVVQFNVINQYVSILNNVHNAPQVIIKFLFIANVIRFF